MREVNLDENTKIPLFPVLTAGFALTCGLVGAILWLTSIDSRAAAAVEKTAVLEKAVIEMSHNMRIIGDNVVDVRERVIRVEQKLQDRR